MEDTYVYEHKIALTNKCVRTCECENLFMLLNIYQHKYWKIPYIQYMHECYLVYTLKIYIDRWKFEFHRREEPTSIYYIWSSNGNASETKANESFDNGVFFDIEAKRTPSIVSKLFSKRSEHIR
jgi:hypothetical protein